jgi:hypothetical protein
MPSETSPVPQRAESSGLPAGIRNAALRQQGSPHLAFGIFMPLH